MTNSSDIRILVVIAYYGTKNRHFLDQLLAEYRSMPYEIDIVVTTEAPKDLDDDIEEIVGLPGPSPRSLPFAHRTVFGERRNDYDLYIYSEDDTLITIEHIEAHLDASALVTPDLLPGLMRFEEWEDGRRSYCSIHSHYRWDTNNVFTFDGRVFAHLTNLHAAAFMLTRDQLARAIESGGFLVGPHEGRYDLMASASADPFMQCNMMKVIEVTNPEAFTVRHLPNVYLGIFGIDQATLDLQLSALLAVARGDAPKGQLMITETVGDDSQYDVLYFDEPNENVVNAVPAEATRIAVIGTGSGSLARALEAPGRSVIGVPLDSVAGAVAAAAGVTCTSPDLDRAIEELSDDPPDTVIVRDGLQFCADPVDFLRRVHSLLRPGGVVITDVPNRTAARVKGLVYRLPGKTRPDSAWVSYSAPPAGNFAVTGMHNTSAHVVRGWLKDAGFRSVQTQLHAGEQNAAGAKFVRSPLGRLFAAQIVGSGRR